MNEVREIGKDQFAFDAFNSRFLRIGLEGCGCQQDLDALHEFIAILANHENCCLDDIMKPIPTWNSVESAALPIYDIPCAVPRNFDVPWRKIAMLDAGADVSSTKLTHGRRHWNKRRATFQLLPCRSFAERNLAVRNPGGKHD